MPPVAKSTKLYTAATIRGRCSMWVLNLLQLGGRTTGLPSMRRLSASASGSVTTVAVLLLIAPLSFAPRAAADTLVVSNSLGPNLTDIVSQPIELSQFNPALGRLTSVRVVANLFLTSALSGSVTNNSDTQSLRFTAGTTDAEILLSGPGFGNPLSKSDPQLLTFGPATIFPNSRLNIPVRSNTLAQSGSASPSDLSAFTGTGTVSYPFSATATSSFAQSGSPNVAKNIAFETLGSADVTITYTFVAPFEAPLPEVPLPSVLPCVFGGLGACGLMQLVGRARSRAIRGARLV